MSDTSLPELPPEAVAPEGFLIDQEGVWYCRDENDWLQVTFTPAWVSALALDADAEHPTIEVSFRNIKNELRTCWVNYTELSSGPPLTRHLGARGLLVVPAMERLFCKYLALALQREGLLRQRLVRRLGFHWLPSVDGDTQLVFNLPDEVIAAREGAPLAEPVVFRPLVNNPAVRCYHAAGTPEEAADMLAPLFADPAFVFIVCASLSAPFLGLAGVDNFALHLYGRSSVGKTTLLQVAASLWGAAGDPQHGGRESLLERWHTTHNAVEIVNATHSGLVLCMDEVGANLDADINIYNLLGGRGKQRMSDSNALQAQNRWQILVLSTGELPIHEKNAVGRGRRAKAGEMSRALDIPIADVATNGGLTPEDAGALARQTKQRCGEVYGVLGPVLIQHFLDSFDTGAALRDALLAALDQCHDALRQRAEAAGFRLEPHHVRAIRRLALPYAIGGWAAEALSDVLTPEQVAQAFEAVTLAWLANQDMTEDEQIESQIREYVLQGGAGVIRHKDWLLIDKATLVRACPDQGPEQTARALAARDRLHREAQKLTSRHAVDRRSRQPYYAIIARRLLSEEELATLDARPGRQHPAVMPPRRSLTGPARPAEVIPTTR